MRIICKIGDDVNIDAECGKNEIKALSKLLVVFGKVYDKIEEPSEKAKEEVENIVRRITGDLRVDYKEVAQDIHLSTNQAKETRCGDNGIFKGVPLTEEEKELSKIARDIYKEYSYDGKYILANGKLVICQSNAKTEELQKDYPRATINPLGDWTGGTNVDSGATNRKLGSDRLGDTDRLFCTEDGRDICPGLFRVWLQKILARAGLPIVTLHSLRHTNITLQLMAGVDMKTVSARAGHSKASTTSDFYSHFLKNSDIHASEVINKIFE